MLIREVEVGLVQRDGLDHGVADRKMARIASLTRLYLAMSGGSTTASGHSSSAWNIGMAERTPEMRAR